MLSLINKGAVLINKSSYEKDGTLDKKTIEDYYLSKAPSYEAKISDDIDCLAFDSVFDTVGSSTESVWSISQFAEENPRRVQ